MAGERDRQFMERALALAARGRGRTYPNPMVGAVIVREGRVVGEGYHPQAGEPHAEIFALRAAGEAARGATVYVTLEPCSHYGRTGPCARALIEAGVARVVAAMEDPNPQVAGKGFALLREAGIEVEVGLCAQEAAALNAIFLTYITQRRPFIALKYAMSLDGKIATHRGDSRWITGPEARRYVHELRDTYQAILVGVGTVLADDPALTTRLPSGGRDPIRIILDSQARTPLGALVLTNPDTTAPTYLAVTAQAPPERRQALAATRHGQLLVLPADNRGRVDLRALLQELARREITNILVEGGATVHAAFVQAGLVDRVYAFIAPKIIGGEEAPGPVGGEGVEKLHEALLFKREETKVLGEDVLVVARSEGRGAVSKDAGK